MNTEEKQKEVISGTYTVRVWTRKKYDQQIYKFYNGDNKLIGLNFHHGTNEIDERYCVPDISLMHIYKRITLERYSQEKRFDEKKVIQKAIWKWLKYVSDDCSDEEYAKFIK